MDWQKHRLMISGALLLTLVGLTVWAFMHRQEQDAGSEQAAPQIDLTGDDIDELEIHRPNEAPTKLAKRNGAWRVVSPVDAEADESTVTTALDKLDELEIVRVASSNAQSHADLEVDDAHAVRVIARNHGTVLADLLLGAFGGNATMVRRHGETPVLAAEGSIKYAFNKELKDWRNREVTDVPPEDVTEVAFTNGNGSWRFVRNASNEWTEPEGQDAIERFAATKIQSIVASLARMRASDFGAQDLTADAAGLGATAATVTLTARAPRPANDAGSPDGGASAEPQRIVLRVGTSAGSETEFYLQREGNPVIFEVTSYLADKIRVNTEAFQAPLPSENPPPPDPSAGGGMPPGMMPPGGGPGGSGDIPPELREQIMRQLQQQQQNPGG